MSCPSFTFGFFYLLLLSASCAAQAIPAATSTEVLQPSNLGPAGIIPAYHGMNISIISASQHDSSNGWSSILTPSVAYRFSPSLTLTASIPIYTYIDVLQNTGTKAKPVYLDRTECGTPGDAALSGIFEAHPELFDYNATLTLGLPSGNTNYGTGSGIVGYNFNNRVEKAVGIFSPDIEFGIANSSNIVGTRAKKSYSSAGRLLHLQAGSSIDLAHNISFEVDGYEDLSISPATIYSTTGRGKKKTTTAVSSSAAEDNGVTSALDIPMSDHLTFSAFYNYSIRSDDNVVGLSLTFLVKAPPHRHGTS